MITFMEKFTNIFATFCPTIHTDDIYFLLYVKSTSKHMLTKYKSQLLPAGKLVKM